MEASHSESPITSALQRFYFCVTNATFPLRYDCIGEYPIHTTFIILRRTFPRCSNQMVMFSIC